MDRIRTLLLARTHIVVMDPDLVASASTRPSRDTDAEKLEDELAQLGYVMSLALATMIRRLPHQTVHDLRGWIFDTLAEPYGDRRPHVPAVREVPRIASWLVTSADQPCPWCDQVKPVGALEPCWHLVCRACWANASFTGCPICHRRVPHAEPFAKLPADTPRVTGHGGTLSLLHLGLDVHGIARAHFEDLVRRTTPLSATEREELEALIDTLGPKTVTWLPERIRLRDTMAIAIARLWLISPHRAAMMRETAAHLQSATDVLRVAAVLMGGNASLVEPMRLRSLARGLRRALLEALERLPLEQVVEDMMRHRGLWKRVGEHLHPFELAAKLPNTALAFAVLRGTKLTTASFGAALRESAVQVPFLYLEDDRIKPIAWAGPIEDALRAGNPRSALARLTHRANELLKRADQLVRVAQVRQLDALQTVVKAVELAAVKGAPTTMLTVASHVARRGRPWPRRVFFPHGDVLSAWGSQDLRTPLRGDAIAVMVGAIRRQLVSRAEQRRQFPRALVDRALVDLMLPMREHAVRRAKQPWPRGSETSLPAGEQLRLFLHAQAPLDAPVELGLSIVLYDEAWRHVATCAADRATVADRAAVHVRDGATAFIDLHCEKLRHLGAKHLVMVVACDDAVPLDRLPLAFTGMMLTPAGAFDPREVKPRFDLRGRAQLTLPLALDLEERRLRWLDVQIKDYGDCRAVGGFRAALAHVARDFADIAATGSRPTLWDLACIHATARGNVIYVRERDGSFTTYRRRDTETKVARLGRLMSGAGDDGRLATLPSVDAPTWFALETAIALPHGSMGYALDARKLSPGCARLSAGDLIRELELG